MIIVSVNWGCQFVEQIIHVVVTLEVSVLGKWKGLFYVALKSVINFPGLFVVLDFHLLFKLVLKSLPTSLVLFSPLIDNTTNLAFSISQRV